MYVLLIILSKSSLCTLRVDKGLMYFPTANTLIGLDDIEVFLTYETVYSNFSGAGKFCLTRR